MTTAGTWNGNPVTKKKLHGYIEDFIKKHQLDPTKLTLTTSAALVYHGYLEEAADIDFVVEPAYFRELVTLLPDTAYHRPFLIKDDDGKDVSFTSFKLMVPFRDIRFELWGEYLENQVSATGTLPVKVETVESVLYMKALLGRSKDLIHMSKVLKKMR